MSRRQRAFIPYKHDPGYFTNEDPQGIPAVRIQNDLSRTPPPAVAARPLGKGMAKPPVQSFGNVSTSIGNPPQRTKGPGAYRPNAGGYK